MLEAAKQEARGRKDIDKAETGAVHFVVAGRILAGEGDVELASDVLDVEGRISVRNALIPEGVAVEPEAMEAGVINPI
jgi:hypothetical protein